VTEMIPVAPGAHYSCGGILANLDGRTSLPGLFAAGEAASTGVQGANRLASNSVTEAIIAGRRAGAAIAASLPAAHPAAANPAAASRQSPTPGSAASPRAMTPAAPKALEGAGQPETGLRRTRAGTHLGAPAAPGSGAQAATAEPAGNAGAPTEGGIGAPAAPGSGAQAATAEAAGNAGAPTEGGNGTSAGARRLALAQAMSRDAGVMRDADGLAQLLREIAEAGNAPGSIAQTAAPAGSKAHEASIETLDGAIEPGGLDLEAVEAANLRVVSMLIAAGARRRAESRGCHRRRDAAGQAAAPWHTLARWDGHQLVVTKEAL
jgi:L-aspartate oxidase